MAENNEGTSTKPALNYQDFIVSTKEFSTFLHTVDSGSLPFILKWGIASQPNIRSALGPEQSEVLEEAVKAYSTNPRPGDSVVVVRIPRETLIEVGRTLRGYELAHPLIGDFPMRFINPKYVQATFCRYSHEVALNPDFMRKR